MRPSFYILSVVALIVLVSCGGIRKNGYYKTSQSISVDSLNKLRSAVRQVSNDSFKACQFHAAGDFILNYRMLYPLATEKGKHPLVLIMHSSGTPIGTDNTSQLGLLAKLWARPSTRQQYPAYVVAPQFPVRTSNYSMDSSRHVLGSLPDPRLSGAFQLVDSLKEVLPIDPQKIYVLGFSMGGSSAINLLELRPDLFAAAVSISGIPSFHQMEDLSKIPVWLIHGNADTENPFASDSVFYREQKSLHNKNLRFWEIDQLQHDIYYKLYSTDLIPEWLFRFKKS